jgi:hypothetical protein
MPAPAKITLVDQASLDAEIESLILQARAVSARTNTPEPECCNRACPDYDQDIATLKSYIAEPSGFTAKISRLAGANPLQCPLATAHQVPAEALMSNAPASPTLIEEIARLEGKCDIYEGYCAVHRKAGRVEAVPPRPRVNILDKGASVKALQTHLASLKEIQTLGDARKAEWARSMALASQGITRQSSEAPAPAQTGSLDQQVAAATATRRTKRQTASKHAADLLLKVKDGTITLDAAIALARAETK